jgi:hypothetical protein
VILLRVPKQITDSGVVTSGNQPRTYGVVDQGGTRAGRSAGSPAVGQALRRRLAFFVATLVAVFLPTVLRRALD